MRPQKFNLPSAPRVSAFHFAFFITAAQTDAQGASPLFALKGLHILAQGVSPGFRPRIAKALQGRHNGLRLPPASLYEFCTRFGQEISFILN